MKMFCDVCDFEFDPLKTVSDNLHCSLQVMHGVELSGEIARESPSTISCRTPVWPRSQAAGRAELRVRSGSSLLKSTQGDAVYVSVHPEFVGIGLSTCDRFDGTLEEMVGSYNVTADDVEALKVYMGTYAESYAPFEPSAIVTDNQTNAHIAENHNSSSNVSAVASCVPEGLATGGFNIKIYAWGINHTLRHELRFSDLDGNQMTAEATIQGSAELTAIFPRWKFPGGLVNVSLLSGMPNAPVALFHTPVVLLIKQRVENAQADWFSEECGATFDSNGLMESSCWPKNVTVFGAGFHTNGRSTILDRGDYAVRVSDSYVCSMGARAQNPVVIRASFVTVESSSTLACHFDHGALDGLEYGSRNFSLDLTYEEEQLITDQDITLRFAEAWFEFICENAQCRVPASGGGAITVTGIGFNHAIPYYCVFTRGTDSSKSPPATWISPTQLLCRTPQWLWSEAYTDLSVITQSTTGGLSVVARRGPFIRSQIFFHAVWWFDSILVRSVFGGNPEQTLPGFPNVYDPQDGTLDVVGVGFDRNSFYYAEFEGTNGDGTARQSNTVPTRALNTSLLRFAIPAFEGREGNVQVEILKCSASALCADSCLEVETCRTKVYTEIGGSLAHQGAEVLTSFIYAVRSTVC